jgi:rubrerythrin
MNDLEFAINMEFDGEKYYRGQAEINKHNSLHSVCLMLAADEQNHAKILTDFKNNKPFPLPETDTLSGIKNIFEGIGGIKADDKETASQLDFYRIASEKEQQSIDLYATCLAKAEGSQEKELFEFLIAQEKKHFEVLDELASMLSRAEEWVEDAEFGIRKEY